MTQIGVAIDVIMQQNSYCIRAWAICHNIGTRPQACGPRARSQYLTYSPCAHAITITCKNAQPVLCRVLSQYFTTGVLSKLYCCSLVHSTNIIGMIGMTMNNWSFAVSSSPDENHCGMVTDTPSALLTQYILHSLLVMEVPLQEHGAQQYNQRQPCWTRISSACTLHTLVLNLVFLHVLTSKHYSKHALTMLYICLE